ncbi:MAG: CrcB family protein [Chloroflexi bacterium]|nr:CrcB family protein [Ktedonobacteraceae bacterium]MBV9021698.1 CrcB family protein [Ktedonobacteraceae bacterium]MBV9707348.1 CrcB family protein [Chloroflexota bacterium]
MAQILSARRRILAVLAGGFCGTLLRVMLSSLIQGWLGKAWPSDILLINITGAFLLAFISTIADATLLIGPTRRLFINVGLLGAYTTFSSLALGDVLLITAGRLLSALLYLLVSSLGGIVAVLVGNLLGDWYVNTSKRLLWARTIQRLTSLGTDVTQPAPLNNRVLRKKILCTNCQTILPSYANFCGLCGVKLEKSYQNMVNT